ncbi:hypothetical protein PHMEG_00011255 [Phytophthora megakarya]|uniref:Uncharacterized protein n=1 Tax=Phytophthora megakarya TaxID=4795 RepID=A0A225WDQ3_9STRA|nr:hypothetical protein PHMEG_00011255 [Phytophthora megakarya]
MPKDPQVSRSEIGKPRSKTLQTKMKAPEYEEDGDQDGSGWTVEDLKSTYHRKELRDFVHQDPLMRILKLKRIADPKEPVTTPATLTNRFDAAMELIRLAERSGYDALFDLDLNAIQAISHALFLLVGEVPPSRGPLPLTTTDVVSKLSVSLNYVGAAEDGSDTSSGPP